MQGPTASEDDFDNDDDDDDDPTLRAGTYSVEHCPLCTSVLNMGESLNL